MTDTINSLFLEIKEKIKNDDPKNSYTAFLANSGSENIAKKVVEEAFEVATASIEGPKHKNGKNQTILESADLIYHLLVLLASKDIEIGDVLAELEKRRQDKNLSANAILKNTKKLHEKQNN
ncbi:MAG: phosphoribosyl-ATP pyrophosphohydrolase [Rickettsiales bacterium]|jgi:phosphoribosyl-ATP pyrophosphohydrolase